MAPSRSRQTKTEEQLRNLKVDLRRVPEWEAERKSILEQYRRFDLVQVAAALFEVEQVSFILYPKPAYSIREYPPPRLRTLKLEDFPHLLLNLQVTEMAEEIRKRHAEATRALTEALARGVTNSTLSLMFTNKAHPDEIAARRREKEHYAQLESRLPRLHRAALVLREIEAMQKRFADRLPHLNNRLALAAQKSTALMRFEERNGNAFAKAAAVDSLSRNRASSLKRMVKRSELCPYCQEPLGADANLDHIYPVAMGGLSVIENVVWCCSQCNAAKSDRGLLQFLKIRGIEVGAAIARLHEMGKHV